ncbi:hypothetical protein [Siminovitchia acidinfaciens]|uniref:hypothetical protein n=1 Tax=Siminovitchia acidinfaciens TaxID=2321395 RepID=UPI0013E0A7DE|nr:hypothetical protein [Siminovitchia acidinfaciens]
MRPLYGVELLGNEIKKEAFASGAEASFLWELEREGNLAKLIQGAMAAAEHLRGNCFFR